MFSNDSMAAVAEKNPGASWLADLDAQPQVFKGDRKAQEALELSSERICDFDHSSLPGWHVVAVSSIDDQRLDSEGLPLLLPLENQIVPRLFHPNFADMPCPLTVARMERKAENLSRGKSQPVRHTGLRAQQDVSVFDTWDPPDDDDPDDHQVGLYSILVLKFGDYCYALVADRVPLQDQGVRELCSRDRLLEHLLDPDFPALFYKFSGPEGLPGVGRPAWALNNISPGLGKPTIFSHCHGKFPSSCVVLHSQNSQSLQSICVIPFECLFLLLVGSG